MNAEYNLEMQNKFNKELNKLYDFVPKSEMKESIPYSKPMNLTPVVSSIDVVGINSAKKTAMPKNLEVLVRKYGVIKEELKFVSQDITNLNKLESLKREFVSKRDGVKFQPNKTDFEKLNIDKKLKLGLRKIKEEITEKSKIIDLTMVSINKRVKDLEELKVNFEKKHTEISDVMNVIKKGEILHEALADKFKGVPYSKISNYKRDLSDGINLCGSIIVNVKEKKDSLLRSMWMETPVREKQDIDIKPFRTNNIEKSM